MSFPVYQVPILAIPEKMIESSNELELVHILVARIGPHQVLFLITRPHHNALENVLFR